MEQQMKKPSTEWAIKRMEKNQNGLATMIGIIQYKGGVAKSTLTMQLAMHLVRTGHKVLVLDCDQQRSISRKYRVPIETDGIGTFFHFASMGQVIDPSHVVSFSHLTRLRGSTEKVGTLGIIAGDISAEKYAETFKETFTSDRVGNINLSYTSAEDFFSKRMAKYSQYYDYILFDTAPGITTNLLTKMVIRTVDNIVIPIDDIDATWSILDLYKELQRQTSALDKQFNAMFAVTKSQPDIKRIHDFYMSQDGFDEKSNAISFILKSVFGNTFVCSNIVPERRSLRRLTPGFGRTTPYTALCAEICDKLQKKRENFFSFCNRTGATVKLGHMLKEFERVENKYPVLLKKPKYQGWDLDES